MARTHFLMSAVLVACIGHYQTQPERRSAEARNDVTTLTGILLVSDRRSDECPADSCRFGLITAEKEYSVHGNTNQLKRYGRRRVTVTGNVFSQNSIDVQSIELNYMPDREIQGLIEQLRFNRWDEPQNVANPTTWIFHFTRPMLQILQAGPAAEDVLLRYLDDPEIIDQITILLGGTGDKNAVLPIIRVMADPVAARNSSFARKINLSANLALTNLTVGDVIWHHGGGITSDACPNDPKSCWRAWWTLHKDNFAVSKTASRNYSNYPNYGIYQEPRSFRSESMSAPSAR